MEGVDLAGTKRYPRKRPRHPHPQVMTFYLAFLFRIPLDTSTRDESFAFDLLCTKGFSRSSFSKGSRPPKVLSPECCCIRLELDLTSTDSASSGNAKETLRFDIET